MRNGYLESINLAMSNIRSYDLHIIRETPDPIENLKNCMEKADAILIGAGAGVSTSAGFVYSGERFEHYFADFAKKYGFSDMYSGGFYPYEEDEVFWAYWARYIYINRYMDPPKPVYQKLLNLIRDKDYFVITTNVDPCFQKAGFDKKRLFYTQGDYGLFQSMNPDIRETFDNEEWILKAMEAQGFVRNEEGIFDVPEDGNLKMEIPTEIIPLCPIDGSNLIMNLRSDDTFVEDEGWHRASNAYAEFLDAHKDGRVLYLELGVGANTPVIIKYPFWYYTNENKNAVYACVNYHEAFSIMQIRNQSILVNGDIGDVLDQLK